MSRVKMPHNNRVSASTALKTNDIWSKTIGYDPYAASKDIGSKSHEEDVNKAASIMLLARLSNLSGAESRGGCKRCGMLGHMHFQCRNPIANTNQSTAQDKIESDDDSSSSEDDNVLNSKDSELQQQQTTVIQTNSSNSERDKHRRRERSRSRSSEKKKSQSSAQRKRERYGDNYTNEEELKYAKKRRYSSDEDAGRDDSENDSSSYSSFSSSSSTSSDEGRHRHKKHKKKDEKKRRKKSKKHSKKHKKDKKRKN